MDNTSHIINLKRRIILKKALMMGGILSLPMPFKAFASTFSPTPTQALGPFYPIVLPRDTDFDLTTIQSKQEHALGQFIDLSGRIMNLEGKPVANAKIEIWQADVNGKYNHPLDRRKVAVDINFQGYGAQQTDHAGYYRFLTIKPGTYPVADDWIRPPHIHVKVTYKDYEPLITQMYFAGDPLNSKDRILHSARNPESLVVTFAANEKQSHLPAKGTFDIFIPVKA